MALPRSGARVAIAPFVLAILIAASVVVRVALAASRQTPYYFPDEYLYSELARSIASGHGSSVLGQPVSMPALLEPLVSSLAWLPGDPALAFRLTQAIHAVAMSLAAIPVYLIGRRLRLTTGWCVAVAAAALASPGLLYTGFATADALGYLLCLVAVHAALRLLSAPTVGRQLVFALAATGATTARLQYAILFPAVLVAGLVIERFRFRAVLRGSWIVAGLVVAAGGAIAVAGSTSVGRYGAIGGFGISVAALRWLAPTGFMLAVASGVVIAPGAVAWLVWGVGRNRDRNSRAFAAFVLAFVPSLVAITTVVNVETASDRFMERYMLVVAPLLALAFAAWARDGAPQKRLAAATGVLIAVGAALLPLSAFAVGQGGADSPVVLAFELAANHLDSASASLGVALLITLAAGIGVSAGGTRGRAAPVAFGLAVCLLVATAAAAQRNESVLSRVLSERVSGSSPTWVDAAGVHDVLLLQTAESSANAAMTQAFWNREVRSGMLLGDGAKPFDGVGRRVSVDDSGVLVERGAAVTSPLLVATGGTRPVFDGPGIVRKGPGFVLLAGAASHRLAALVEGLADDGWLSANAAITVYPGTRGCRSARLQLALPRGHAAVSARLEQAGRTTLITIAPNKTSTVALRATGSTPATARLSSDEPVALANPLRLVLARASVAVAPC